MASVGEAAARGLESGFGLGLRLQDRQRADEEAQRRRQLQDEDRVYVREQRVRQRELDDEDRALKALDAQYDALKSEGEGYAQRYGMDVPDDVAQPYARRVAEASGARNAMLRKRYEPIVKQRQQAAADLASRLQAGQIDVQDVPDGDLYRAIVTSTRRDPSDLLSVDGKPSRVAQSVTDVMTGLETGNEQMMLAGANVLLEPELKVGVGEKSPHGGTIVGKEIIKMIPDPRDPAKFMPVVRVYVKREGGKAGDGRKDGATGYYDAPITENRSSDPEDTVRSIDLNRAMDYAEQLQTFSMMLDDPGLRGKIERGAAEAARDPDNFLEAFYAVKGRMPERKVDYKSVPAGGLLVGIDPRTGKEVSRVEGPRKAATGGLQGTIDAISGMEERGEIDAATAADLRKAAARRQATGLKGGGGGSADAAGPAPAAGLTGQALLDTLSEDDAVIVQGLVDGSISPKEISTRGNRKEKMLALAKRVDPTAHFGPEGRLKEVPAKAQQALLENATNLRRAERALRLIGGAPAQPGDNVDRQATGLKGYLPNQVLNRIDPQGVDARAALADLGSLVIHERSGAAVTAAEFPRLAPFIPTEKDDADTVKKKLQRFVQVYRDEIDALKNTYGPDNGFRGFNVGGRAAAGPAAPAAQDQAAPQRLPADQRAAADAYARLPSGAVFVDPNGVTRRKP